MKNIKRESIQIQRAKAQPKGNAKQPFLITIEKKLLKKLQVYCKFKKISASYFISKVIEDNVE